eukprot:2920047-Pleurochrysis_carterae.AAC.2
MFCDHHRCKGTTTNDRRCGRRAGSNGYCCAHSDQAPVKTAHMQRCKASEPKYNWEKFWDRYDRATRKTCEPGWVYIKIEEAHAPNHRQAPRCKIGQSQKLEKRRIAGLVDHWSERVTNYKALELCVHDLLGDWRLRELSDVPLSGRTEWFELPVDKAVQAIKRAIVEGSGLFKLVPDEFILDGVCDANWTTAMQAGQLFRSRPLTALGLRHYRPRTM